MSRPTMCVELYMSLNLRSYDTLKHRPTAHEVFHRSSRPMPPSSLRLNFSMWYRVHVLSGRSCFFSHLIIFGLWGRCRAPPLYSRFFALSFHCSTNHRSLPLRLSRPTSIFHFTLWRMHYAPTSCTSCTHCHASHSS